MIQSFSSRKVFRGFTLLELVVAIVILGILSALAIPTFSNVMTSSQKKTDQAAALSMSRYAVADAAFAHQPVDETYLSNAVSGMDTTVSLSGHLATFSVKGRASVCVTEPAAVNGTPAAADCSVTPPTTTTVPPTTTTTTVPPTTTTTTTTPPPVLLGALIAGTPGSSGTSGDGGAATAALLNTPFADAVSPTTGVVYFTDNGSGTVRAIDPVTGNISLVAGTPDNNAIAGDGGPASAALMGYPTGIAVSTDGTTLYVAGNDAFTGIPEVRAINLSGSTITNVAGSGVALAPGYITSVAGDGTAYQPPIDGLPAIASPLFFPSGLGVSPDGQTLYIGDTIGSVRSLDLTTGILNTAAGGAPTSGTGDGGPAIAAGIVNPQGVSVSHDGTTLFITDWDANNVRAVNLSGSTITNVAGSGVALAPGYITTVDGNGTTALAGEGGAATAAGQWNPSAGVLSLDGSNLYVMSHDNNVVQASNTTTGTITRLSGDGTPGYVSGAGPSAKYSGPTDMALSNDGHTLYVVDSGNHVIRTISGL